MAKGAYKYRDSDPDTIRSHAENKGGYDSPIKEKYKLYKPKDGKNRIRIMGRTWDDDVGPRHWAYPLWLHYNVGPDDARYPCLAKANKGRCPICEERAEATRAGDEQRAKDLRPSPTQLVWVIDRNKEEDGPLVFLMPQSKLEGPICSLSRDPDTGELRKVDHPDKGHDVIFDKSGTGQKTQYSAVQVVGKKSFLCDDEKDQKKWLDYVEDNPLPECIHFYDAEYISKVFGGGGSRRGKDDDDDDGGSRRRRSRDDEEDTSVRSRSMDDEDEKPRRRSRSDDDDELDAPSEGRRRSKSGDDDEDEKPRRRSSSEDEDEGKGRRGEDPDSSRGRTSSERSRRGEDDEDEKPRRRSSSDDDDEAEEKPRRGRELREEVKEGLSRRRSRSED